MEIYGDTRGKFQEGRNLFLQAVQAGALVLQHRQQPALGLDAQLGHLTTLRQNA